MVSFSERVKVMQDSTLHIKNPSIDNKIDIKSPIIIYDQPTIDYVLPNNVISGVKGIGLTRDSWSHIKFLETDVIFRNKERLVNKSLGHGSKIKNIYHEYHKTITLTGIASENDPESFTLNTEYPFEIQRINLRFNDTTSKSFSINVMGFMNGTNNAIIMSYSNHYDQNYEDTTSRIFLFPNKISIDFTSDIAYNTCDVTIFLRELFSFQDS